MWGKGAGQAVQDAASAARGAAQRAVAAGHGLVHRGAGSGDVVSEVSGGATNDELGQEHSHASGAAAPQAPEAATPLPTASPPEPPAEDPEPTGAGLPVGVAVEGPGAATTAPKGNGGGGASSGPASRLVDSLHASTTALGSRVGAAGVGAGAAAAAAAERSAVKARELAAAVHSSTHALTAEASSRLGSAKDHAASQYSAAVAHVERKVEHAKDTATLKALQLIHDIVDTKIMPRIARTVKASITGDPDMPRFLKRGLDGAVDSAMPEIKDEIMDVVESKVRRSVHDERLYAAPPPCSQCCGLTRVRATVLYTLLPFDKSLWGKLRNPLYWFLAYALGMFPIWGVQQLWFFVLFCLLDRRDEFQLTKFVIGFKASQFISVGIVAVYLGAIQLLRCTAGIHGAQRCEDDGPGAAVPFFYGDLVFFVAQSVLCWVAYAFLRCSSQKGGRLYKPLPSDPHYRSEVRKGGRILYWLLWDTFVAVVVAAVGVVLLFSGRTDITSDAFDQNEHLLKLYLFWLKSLYGILMFPWFILSMPLMVTLVLHAKPTAYNRAGQTVPVARAKDKARLAAAAAATGTGGSAVVPV